MEIAQKVENVLTWKCKNCALSGEIFAGGWREGVMAKLVHDYKYSAVRAAGRSLAEILSAVIPVSSMQGQEVVIVPLPTIGKHVRERGFDHTYKLAKELAKLRGWKVKRLLARRYDTVQVGAKAGERVRQAARAYMVVGKIDEEVMYILLDDVWTTGASMLESMKIMQKAGARNVSGAVVAVSR